MKLLGENYTKRTVLAHDGAVLVTNQTIKKLEFKMGERIMLHASLTNIGNKSTSIRYLWNPFFAVVCDKSGTPVWANGPNWPPMEYSTNRDKTIKPNESFTGNIPYADDYLNPFELDAPGNYTVYAVADIHEDDESSRIFVWSKPIQIVVLHEKYSIADMRKLPPLGQYMAGVQSYNTRCGEGLELLIKSSTNLPVCARPNAATKLIERGWAKKPPGGLTEISRDIATVTIPPGFGNPSSDKTYEPVSIKVVVGVNNTVHWMNKADAVTTIISDGFKESNSAGEIFGGGTMRPTDIYEFTFTKPGKYGYHGEPQAWQKGSITVLPLSNTGDIANQTQSAQIIPSYVSRIGHQTTFAGYAGQLSCPIMPFSMSAKIVNYTGFYGVYNTLNDASVVGPNTYTGSGQEELDKSGNYRMDRNFVLEPGHNGTITYTATLSVAKCAGGCPDDSKFPSVDNQTNIAEFIHRQNNEMLHSHDGLAVRYEPVSESIVDGQTVTLKVTIMASSDVPHGTYWVILTPGNCAGGPLILLTVSDCEK